MTSDNNSKSQGILYHLVETKLWEESKKSGQDYYPSGYEKEGFIHLSNSPEKLLRIANKYYKKNPQSYLVLEIDPKRIKTPRKIIFEEGVPVGKNKKKESSTQKPAILWPHLYGGGLNSSFVTKELKINRDDDGNFLPL